MSGRTADIDERFRWTAYAAVVLFGVALAGGLALHVLDPSATASVSLFHAGFVTLMIAPALRLLVAVADSIGRRDWTFVAMTGVVVVELAVVMWRAAHKL
jgi:hypothetical protein